MLAFRRCPGSASLRIHVASASPRALVSLRLIVSTITSIKALPTVASTSLITRARPVTAPRRLGADKGEAYAAVAREASERGGRVIGHNRPFSLVLVCSVESSASPARTAVAPSASIIAGGASTPAIASTT